MNCFDTLYAKLALNIFKSYFTSAVDNFSNEIQNIISKKSKLLKFKKMNYLSYIGGKIKILNNRENSLS